MPFFMAKFAGVCSSRSCMVSFPVYVGTVPPIVTVFIADPTMILPRSAVLINHPISIDHIQAQHIATILTVGIMRSYVIWIAHLGLRTASPVVALYTTRPAITLNSCADRFTSQPRLLTGPSVMALLSTYSTSESPINGIFLKFWTVVSSMPLTSTVFTVKFYSYI